MAKSQWHRFYTANVNVRPEALFELVSDLPNYPRWLPQSGAYAATTDVAPYPVQLGSKYHDGKPGRPGKEWWGTVTGFQPPGAIDFHHVIDVRQLRAAVDVHIHYSLEREGQGTRVNRWLVLDITMPAIFRPLQGLMTDAFDKENIRTMDALKKYAEANPEGTMK
jgi:Polyketide cyclase / dehydrase and lipid transport